MTRFSSSEYRRRFADKCEEYSEGLETSHGEEIIMEVHQQSGMINSADALRSGSERFSIVHPCGTGKTILEAAFVKASQEAKDGLSPIERNRRKDLILTVERSLITGIREEIERVLGREVGIWGNGGRNLEPGVVVASIQALQHHKDDIGRFLDPTKVSLLIGDEAHKFITENRNDVVSQFNRAIKIGLTATPEWPDNRNISTVWGQPIDTLTLKEGMERGVNVPALFYMYRNDVNGDNIPVVNGEYERTALGKALKAVQIENAICNIYDDLPRNRRKRYPTLIYVPTLQILDDVRTRMQHQFGNLNISSWNGKTPNNILEKEKREFREGELDILILCEMGGLGLNLPRARFLIDASPTLSKNKLEQRHGRVLRIIRPGSLEAESGFQKGHSLIYQILPRATRFRPVTLLDVLETEPGEYEPGRLLPAGISRPRGPGDDEEVRELVRHFKSRPIRSNMQLLEASDLRDILTRDDLPQLDRDGFAYFNE